jgi:S-disulfanyl-L-cysteine oxidoreductase SoxD
MQRSGAALAAVASGLLAAGAAWADHGFGIGTPATPEEIAGWDIDIAPDGTGLPPGRGSVAQGAVIFAATCAACHGARGEGGQQDRLVGGQGTLRSAKPVKTVGSYWPYATTLFDYIRRAMPLTAPQSLTADQVYAVSAYILYLNGIVPQGAVLDGTTLPKVVMPNRGGFIDTEPANNGTKPPQ